MIYLFTGQPHSGKTTLATAYKRYLLGKLSGYTAKEVFHVDGDDLRQINNNVDYSQQGRRNNIANAFSIAKYLDRQNQDVILSLVSPYRDLRDELKASFDVIEIYCHTTNIRGRESFHVMDYEPPIVDFIDIDTTDISENESLVELITKIQDKVTYGNNNRQ